MVRFRKLPGEQGGKELLILEAESHTGGIILFPVAECWAPAAGGGTTQGSGQAGGQFLQTPPSAGQSAEESLQETFRSGH